MNMQASLNKWAALNCGWGTSDRVHFVRLAERQIVIVLTSRSGKGLVTQGKKTTLREGILKVTSQSGNKIKRIVGPLWWQMASY